jgi:uncharacterized SAM-binding protein YcdF (DUF218 family)
MLSVLKALALPPGNLLVAAIAGLLLRRRFIRLGHGLAAVSVGLLYLLSTPVVSSFCLSLLEDPYTDPLARPAQAIVALGGGAHGFAPEYGTDVLTHLSMARLRYAAKLQRASGKPLLVSGGSVLGRTKPEAQMMRTVLVEEMDVPVRWAEDRSVDTFSNATESYRVLAPLGITTVYLVTHAWHMPRARLAFEHAGFAVVPAPTGFTSPDPPATPGRAPTGMEVHDFLPNPGALLKSYYFWHEVLGYLAYAVRMRL